PRAGTRIRARRAGRRRQDQPGERGPRVPRSLRRDARQLERVPRAGKGRARLLHSMEDGVSRRRAAGVSRIREALSATGLPAGDLHDLPTSAKRFPDGAQYRIEIPSTEGPRCLEAVLEEAGRLDVAVHRVSQGSGVFMLTDAELDAVAHLGAAAGVEVSLFARPNAGWTTGATAYTTAGAAHAPAVRGQDQLVAVLEDAVRAAEHGIRSVLLADVGAVHAFAMLRDAGVLPAEMQAKVSVMLPVANAATARVLEQLGASTLNLPPDLSLAQIAAIRAAVDL